jgi:hypothetical protein
MFCHFKVKCSKAQACNSERDHFRWNPKPDCFRRIVPVKPEEEGEKQEMLFGEDAK